MKNKDWYNHATNTIERIKSFNLHSLLGNYQSPEEYFEIVEDYVKLFYKINAVPPEVLEQFNRSKTKYESFKYELKCLCDYLLTEAKKHDNDTPQH